MGALREQGLGPSGWEGGQSSPRAGPPRAGYEGGAEVAFRAGLGGSYQLGPVQDVLPGEVLTGELLSKLLLRHLGHQEVRLGHQGRQHVRDAPRACQDQPRGGLRHSPRNPLRWREGQSPASAPWAALGPALPVPSLCPRRGPGRRPQPPGPRPPTSKVLGPPLTSRQRTGISMLPVPVDGAPVRSPQGPGSREPGPPVG